MNSVNVAGAGLAGCEAAWQIARRGIRVNLYDVKPKAFSPAHKSEKLCELVCSNSFKAERIDSAPGLLKEELRALDSLVLRCAEECRVPAGGALAVDREKFSSLVTERIKNNSFISFISEEVKSVDEDSVTVLATGPLTFDSLADYVSKLCGGALSFYDAAAPIVTAESVDMERAFFGSRYGKGDENSYLNCPLSEEEYAVFHETLVSAQRAPVHGFDARNPKVYEGCMPVEVMASRGFDALRYGPMKPVGLKDPRTGKRPFAAVQLRREDLEGKLYNIVGFQTNLKFGEQKRTFGLIPALRRAEIVRYGVMHRNTFINSPKVLRADYSVKTRRNLFFAGQITGTEGYMESVSSGLTAGINAARLVKGEGTLEFPPETMTGALARYVSGSPSKDFQPMGANFGLLPELEEKIRDKKTRYRAFAERALKALKETVVR